mmetsp:Transcript_46375/g.113078  ORF Transcript_46375/g.113078 Transcript_46375/m.113078 type:complete len:470 (-) Transcript_46375:139-1548(-)
MRLISLKAPKGKIRKLSNVGGGRGGGGEKKKDLVAQRKSHQNLPLQRGRGLHNRSSGLLAFIVIIVIIGLLGMTFNTLYSTREYTRRSLQLVFRKYDQLNFLNSTTPNNRQISAAITHILAPNTTYNETYNLYYQCNNRRPLPDELRPLLEFTTKVSTSKKILFMGDSVSIQLSQIFEEAAGSKGRSVLKYSWGTHEGIHVANVNGGGVVAGYRILHLLRHVGLRKLLPNAPGGGWRVNDVHDLLNNYTTFHNNETIGSFDVMVFRIPHGWIHLSEITEQNLFETVEIAGSLFGVKKVIFISVPFSNNIQNEADMEELEQVNNKIRDFASNTSAWNKTKNVESVAVLELGNLVEALVQDNGRRLGMNVSDVTYKNQRCCSVKGLGRSVPLLCGELAGSNATSCVPNAFSLDGMHYCFSAIGGRMVAGISCLIGCLNDDTCEQRCNDQFMSLQPVTNMKSRCQTLECIHN